MVSVQYPISLSVRSAGGVGGTGDAVGVGVEVGRGVGSDVGVGVCDGSSGSSGS